MPIEVRSLTEEPAPTARELARIAAIRRRREESAFAEREAEDNAVRDREERYAYRDDDFGPHGTRRRRRAPKKEAATDEDDEGVWDTIKDVGSGILSGVKDTAGLFAEWAGFGNEKPVREIPVRDAVSTRDKKGRTSKEKKPEKKEEKEESYSGGGSFAAPLDRVPPARRTFEAPLKQAEPVQPSKGALAEGALSPEEKQELAKQERDLQREFEREHARLASEDYLRKLNIEDMERAQAYEAYVAERDRLEKEAEAIRASDIEKYGWHEGWYNVPRRQRKVQDGLEQYKRLAKIRGDKVPVPDTPKKWDYLG